VLAAVVLAGAVMSEAFGYTADELRTLCNAAIKCDDDPKACDSEQFAGRGACHAYVRGFLSGLAAALAHVTTLGTKEKEISYFEARRKYMKYCPSETATLSQIPRIFIKYINDHPEKLNDQASNILLAALQKAFPCEE